MPDRRLLPRLLDMVLFAVVPVVVYTLSAIHWLIDPFRIRHRLFNTMLPELTRFPSATSRVIALHTVHIGCLSSIVLLLLVAVSLNAIFHFDESKYYTGWNITLFLLVLGVIFLGWVEVLRVRLLLEPTRKALRRKLTRLGLATCIACGCNLKGNTADRCPECGHESL